MNGLFHGKSPSKMDDDWGYPISLRKPPFLLVSPTCSAVDEDLREFAGWWKAEVMFCNLTHHFPWRIHVCMPYWFAIYHQQKPQLCIQMLASIYHTYMDPSWVLNHSTHLEDCGMPFEVACDVVGFYKKKIPRPTFVGRLVPGWPEASAPGEVWGCPNGLTIWRKWSNFWASRRTRSRFLVLLDDADIFPGHRGQDGLGTDLGLRS